MVTRGLKPNFLTSFFKTQNITYTNAPLSSIFLQAFQYMDIEFKLLSTLKTASF